jgi:hypothetical protein
VAGVARGEGEGEEQWGGSERGQGEQAGLEGGGEGGERVGGRRGRREVEDVGEGEGGDGVRDALCTCEC